MRARIRMATSAHDGHVSASTSTSSSLVDCAAAAPAADTVAIPAAAMQLSVAPAAAAAGYSGRCKFDALGQCKFGSSCRHPHAASEDTSVTRALLDAAGRPLCAAALWGMRCPWQRKHVACEYSHDVPPELRRRYPGEAPLTPGKGHHPRTRVCTTQHRT